MSNPESTVFAGTTTDELVAGIRADARRFVIHLHIAVAIQTVGYCVAVYVLATNLC